MQTQTQTATKLRKFNDGSNRPIKAIFEVNLGKGHDGLTLIAKDLGVKTENLARGEFVLFLNKAKTAVKIFAANNVVAYYKDPNRRPMTMEDLTSIPNCFNGVSFDFNAKLERLLNNEIIS